jgi:hypothetical protein
VLLGFDQNYIYGLLIAVPPLLALVVCWGLWRWAKRTDEQEARERADRLYNRPD